MFGMTIDGKISKIEPKVTTERKKNLKKVCDLVLMTEFSGDIATALGKAAAMVYKHMTGMDLGESKLPYNAVTIQISFDVGEKKPHIMNNVQMSMITATPGRKEGSSPMLKLAMTFPTNDADLCFCSHYQEANIQMKIEKQQTELEGVE